MNAFYLRNALEDADIHGVDGPTVHRVLHELAVTFRDSGHEGLAALVDVLLPKVEKLVPSLDDLEEERWSTAYESLVQQLELLDEDEEAPIFEAPDQARSWMRGRRFIEVPPNLPLVDAKNRLLKPSGGKA